MLLFSIALFAIPFLVVLALSIGPRASQAQRELHEGPIGGSVE